MRTKGSEPFVPLAERMEIVRTSTYVDQVHAETVPDKLDTWRAVGFDRIFKGDDWRGTPKGDKLERDFAEVGVEVVYFPYTMHTSSTKLRRALGQASPCLCWPETSARWLGAGVEKNVPLAAEPER